MSIQKLLKRNGKNRILLAIFFICCSLILYVIWNSDKSLENTFKDRCTVESVDDAYQCMDKNPWVRVRFDDAYETPYNYLVDGVEVAYYVDLDLEGYSLLSLIDKETATAILNKEVFYVDGKLTNLTGTHKEGIDKVIDYYKNDLFTEYDSVMIDEMILPFELDNYAEEISNSYIAIGILVSLALLSIYFLGTGIYQIIYYQNTKIYRTWQQEIDKLNDELESSMKYKNLYLLEHYIIEKAAIKTTIAKLDDIAWMYERVMKQHGIAVNKLCVVALKNGKTLQGPVDILEKLQTRLNSQVLVGYTKENQMEYRRIVQEYKNET